MLENKALSLQMLFNTNYKFKALVTRIKNKAGRSYGQIVSPRRGSFCRHIYRFVDFKRIIFPEESGLVIRLEYDPNRSAPIALICFPSGLFINILAPSKLKEGDIIRNLTTTPLNMGDSATLVNLPTGSLLFNIGLTHKNIGKFMRSAGCSGILVKKDFDHSLLKLKSGELRYFNSSVTATLGTVGSEDHFLKHHIKAGTVRRLGRRPRTRPSAMNPVDHPMGGRTKGGSQPVTAKGILNFNRSTKKFYHPAILYTKRQMKFKRF